MTISNKAKDLISLAILVYVVILGLSRVGISQNITLTTNHSSDYVCPGEDVFYMCSTKNRILLWILPRIMDPIAVITDQNKNNTMQFYEVFSLRSNGNETSSIVIIRSNNILNESTVQCTSGGETMMLPYIPIHELGPPVISEVTQVFPYITNFEVNVKWDAAPFVVWYTLSCTDGECDTLIVTGNQSQANIKLNDTKSVNISVEAENMCDVKVSYFVLNLMTSNYPSETSDLPFTDTTKLITPSTQGSMSAPALGAIVGGIVGALLVMAVVGFVIVIGVLLYRKNEDLSTAASKSLRKDDAQDLQLPEYAITAHICSQTQTSGYQRSDNSAVLYSHLQHGKTKLSNRQQYGILETKAGNELLITIEVTVQLQQ